MTSGQVTIGAGRGSGLLRLLLGALLAACGTFGSGGAADEDSVMDGMPQVTAGDSLRLELQAPSSVRAGDVVTFVVRVENVSTRSVDLYLRGREPTVDIIVRDVSGVEMWRRLDGAVIPAIIRLETLPAGGVLELRDEWRQRTSAGAAMPAGVFTVHGEILTDNRPLVTAPSTLRIGD